MHFTESQLEGVTASFVSKVASHLLRAVEGARRLGLSEEPESYLRRLVPLLGPALAEIDRGFRTECTFLAIWNHTHTNISVAGTTNTKEYLLRPNPSPSRFLDDVADGRLIEPVLLRRNRYPQDWFWERVRTCMALGPYAEPWRILGIPLRLPSGTNLESRRQPDGFLVLVGEKDWPGVPLDDPSLRLLEDLLEGTVKTLQMMSQMAETQAVIQSSQRIDQRDALHSFLQPLMNQELSIASAEMAIRAGNRKEALEAVEKVRARMVRAAIAARNYLNLAFADQSISPQTTHRGEWTQTESIVSKVAEVMRSEATAKRQTIITSLRAVPKVPMSAADLELVVQNLLHNAIKYSFAGTKIEVLLVEREPEVVVDFVSHGIPIPPEDFENVFRVSFRTALASKMTFTAAGIGLSSARAKVRAQGGRLFVKASIFEHKVNEGDQYENVFRLRLHRGKKGDR